jgi:hypothetical protein
VNHSKTTKIGSRGDHAPRGLFNRLRARGRGIVGSAPHRERTSVNQTSHTNSVIQSGGPARLAEGYRVNTQSSRHFNYRKTTRTPLLNHLSMHFEDYLLSRGIRDDSDDAQLEAALKPKMFGVTFNRYIKSANTNESDFIAAFEFIQQVNYLDKQVLPGQSYQQLIERAATLRGFNLTNSTPQTGESTTAAGNENDQPGTTPNVPQQTTNTDRQETGSSTGTGNPGGIPEVPDSSTAQGSGASSDSSNQRYSNSEIPLQDRPNPYTPESLAARQFARAQQWMNQNKGYVIGRVFRHFFPNYFSPLRIIITEPPPSLATAIEEDVQRAIRKFIRDKPPHGLQSGVNASPQHDDWGGHWANITMIGGMIRALIENQDRPKAIRELEKESQFISFYSTLEYGMEDLKRQGKGERIFIDKPYTVDYAHYTREYSS